MASTGEIAIVAFANGLIVAGAGAIYRFLDRSVPQAPKQSGQPDWTKGRDESGSRAQSLAYRFGYWSARGKDSLVDRLKSRLCVKRG